MLLELFLFLALILLLAKSAQPFFEEKRIYHYRLRRYLMTKAEADLFRKLHILYGSKCIIVPQVRLSSIFDEKVKGQSWRAALSHINQKSVDFVLLRSDTFEIGCVIELDDYTHDKKDRQNRDKEVDRIFFESSIPLYHLTNTLCKTPSQIKKDIDNQKH